MRISACTIALRDRRCADAFRTLSACGYDCADALAYGKDAHVSHTMSDEVLCRVLSEAEAAGVRIGSLAGSVGSAFSDPDESARLEEMDRVRQEIDLAVRAGAHVIRISPGKGLVWNDIRDRSLPCLKEVCRYAGEKGIRMVMENHSDGIAGDPLQVARLCFDVGSPFLGILYDPGNLLGALVDYRKGFDILKDHILHVHLKDGYPHFFGNDGFAPQRLFCTLMGRGELDIPWIMDSLAGTKYGGLVSVEFEGTWHPEYRLPPPEEGLRQFREYMRRWFP